MEDKAVIQPGPSDIPTVRVQLGQLMNSAQVPGGSQPCSTAHKRLLFTFLFFSKCLDVLRAQRSLKPRPLARASLKLGNPGLELWGPPHSLLSSSHPPCHVLDSGSRGGFFLARAVQRTVGLGCSASKIWSPAQTGLFDSQAQLPTVTEGWENLGEFLLILPSLTKAVEDRK